MDSAPRSQSAEATPPWHAPQLQVPPLQGPPLDYAGLTRPGRRWWRLPVSLLVFAGVFVAAQVILAVVLAIFGVVVGWDPAWFVAGFLDPANLQMTPGTLLYTNLMLASLIPATMISTRLGQGIRWGYVHSVAGRFRWGLFGRLLLLLLPLWALLIGLSSVLSGSLSRIDPHPELWAFLGVVWLTTMLQCAGEEYAFRGWLLQNLGGLFGIRILAWGLPLVVSAILFGLAHGSLDPWVLGSLMIMAVATALLTWRSGGLEAAVALHTLNNMLVYHVTLVWGGLDDAFVGTETTGVPLDLVVSLVGHGAAVALVWWWLKRRGVPNRTVLDPRVPRLLRPLPRR